MSLPGRVESKNLFNLRLTGQYDDEVAADILKSAEKMGPIFAGFAEASKIEDDGTAIAGVLRDMMDSMIGHMNEIPYFMAKIALCHQEKLTVPATDINSAEVSVLVHRPKNLKGPSPAIVYVHGGGVVAGTAKQMTGHCSDIADHCGVIVFNVDYRLAPEAKCPENILDFYSCLKHVLAHSSSLGVDPARVAIMGESGGGYLTAALSVMLARKEEAHLVKLAIPVIPMLDDYCWGDTNSMTKEEAGMAFMMQKVWAAIGTDVQAQRASADPLLFPAKAPEDLLTRFPPTVILESEFDFYITEATRFARKLNAAGRLLELVVIPGIGHGHAMEPRFKKFAEQMDILKTILTEYLIQ